MQTFDLDEALTMHRAWKMKFQLALGSVQDRDFDTRPLGDATQCGLGKWLKANPEQLEGFAAAPELRRQHEEFHRRSQAIADAIRDGRILHMGDPAIVDYLTLSEQIEALLQSLDAHCRCKT